jgi:hypothetical protein
MVGTRAKPNRRAHEDGAVTGAPDLNASTVKLSVNVSEDVGQRLRQVAFEQRLSESSIVEVALGLLFKRSDAQSLGMLLRQQGATLRRKRRKG